MGLSVITNAGKIDFCKMVTNLMVNCVFAKRKPSCLKTNYTALKARKAQYMQYVPFQWGKKQMISMFY